MAKARILTSHTYNEDEADEIAKGIYADYAPLLRELRDLLIIRKNETENKDLF
jgi:Nucleotidyltransferase substrate binding protein like.